MGNCTFRRTILTSLAILCSLQLWSQVESPFHPALRPDAYLISEQLVLFTDRSVYIQGEHIHFRADRILEGVSPEESWSSVIYAELVTPSGISVARGKYALIDGHGSGSLHIPSGTLTGNYFLRCYTRWMRNSGPRSFAYYPLKIINPMISEVVNPGNGSVDPETTGRRQYASGILECGLEAPVYERGEEVECLLSLKPEGGMDLLECCITVVPLEAIDTMSGQLTFREDPERAREYRVSYLPDLTGVSISGTMVSADQDGLPVPYTKLYFSLLGGQPDYFTAITDENGRFTFFTPDRKGSQEMYVTPDPSAGGGVEIRIDQDFDREAVHMGGESFFLTEGEKETAARMALLEQLSRAYGSSSGRTDPAPDRIYTDTTPFYGTALNTLYMNDYVELPSLEEVFINLIPEVGVVSRRGTSSIQVVGPNPSLQLYQPLLLVDLIPVFDHRLILQIAPEKVWRVDVINEIYIKGDVFHGGVVSIISRSGDMAGIDLPEGSYFFDFLSLQPAETLNHPLYGEADRVPDFRNTVYWLDRLSIERGTPEELTFRAPSNPGEYVILVRGINPSGGVIAASKRFRVE